MFDKLGEVIRDPLRGAPRGLLCTRLLLENADRGELAIAAVDYVLRDETRRTTEDRDEATIGAARHLASIDCFVRADRCVHRLIASVRWDFRP